MFLEAFFLLFAKGTLLANGSEQHIVAWFTTGTLNPRENEFKAVLSSFLRVDGPKFNYIWFNLMYFQRKYAVCLFGMLNRWGESVVLLCFLGVVCVCVFSFICIFQGKKRRVNTLKCRRCSPFWDKLLINLALSLVHHLSKQFCHMQPRLLS